LVGLSAGLSAGGGSEMTGASPPSLACATEVSGLLISVSAAPTDGLAVARPVIRPRPTMAAAARRVASASGSSQLRTLVFAIALVSLRIVDIRRGSTGRRAAPFRISLADMEIPVV